MSAIVNIEYLQKTPKKSFTIHFRYDSPMLTERTARREAFLAEMECVVPWRRLEAPIESHYPLARKGREPYRLSTMSRVRLPPHRYGYPAPRMEKALHRFAGLNARARPCARKGRGWPALAWAIQAYEGLRHGA